MINQFIIIILLSLTFTTSAFGSKCRTVHNNFYINCNESGECAIERAVAFGAFYRPKLFSHWCQFDVMNFEVNKAESDFVLNVFDFKINKKYRARGIYKLKLQFGYNQYGMGNGIAYCNKWSAEGVEKFISYGCLEEVNFLTSLDIKADTEFELIEIQKPMMKYNFK